MEQGQVEVGSGMDTDEEVSAPTTRPDIVVADGASLAYFALAEQLPLLHAIGDAVLLLDVVASEATVDVSPGKLAGLDKWLAAGADQGRHPVRMEKTEIGEVLCLARQANWRFRAPRTSEAAITEWLVATVREAVRPTIVLADDSRISGIVADQDVGAEVSVVTTRALLALAEEQGLLASAEATWETMLDRAANTIAAILDRHVMPSRERLDEWRRVQEAERAARTPEDEARIAEALRDYGIEYDDG